VGNEISLLNPLVLPSIFAQHTTSIVKKLAKL